MKKSHAGSGALLVYIGMCSVVLVKFSVLTK